MGIGAADGARGTWFFVVLGAVIGLALGVLVSVATDIPLAIEAGLYSVRSSGGSCAGSEPRARPHRRSQNTAHRDHKVARDSSHRRCAFSGSSAPGEIRINPAGAHSR